MLTLQVLPTLTFSVKVCVCVLIGPDNTSNAAICVRAGGARSAIGAVFRLLFVGQPFGPGAAVPRVPFVAAIAAAATSASASTVAKAIANGAGAKMCRTFRCLGTRSMISSSDDWALAPRCWAEGIPHEDREGRRRTCDRTTHHDAPLLPARSRHQPCAMLERERT